MKMLAHAQRRTERDGYTRGMQTWQQLDQMQ